MLLNTHLPKGTCNDKIKEMWTNLDKVDDSLSVILTKNREFKQTLLQELKILIRCNNTMFLMKNQHIKFKIGDVCLVKRSNETFKLVQIESLSPAGNYATIRIFTNRRLAVQKTHTSQLALVHRDA